jgi:hypothetical protein
VSVVRAKVCDDVRLLGGDFLRRQCTRELISEPVDEIVALH